MSAQAPAGNAAELPPDRLAWALRALIALALIMPTGLFGWAAWRDRAHLQREAEQSVDHMAAVLHEHALKVFRTHELVLDQVDRRLAGLAWDTLEQDAALQRLLADLDNRLDEVAVIAAADPMGRVRSTSRSLPRAPVHVSNRDYFQVQQARDAGPYIGRPVTGRLTGQRQFSLSQRRSSPNAQFDGIIHVAVSTEYFMQFWAEAAAAHSDSVMLVRDDGAVLARYPANPAVTSLPEGPGLQALRQRPAGQFTAVSPFDGQERIHAFRRVGTYPAFIIVATELRALRQAWWSNLTILALFWLTATLAAVSAVLVARRRFRREQAAVARWQETARQLEAEMRAHQATGAALHQAQKMEAMGQITGGVAHDFNNLLQAITANLHLLESKLAEARLRSFVWNAQEAVARGAKLTQQLMAFARRQRLEPQVTDVAGLAGGLVELLRRTLGTPVQIQLDLAPETWPALVDPNQLDLVLLNLAINARDAMPQGGTLTMRTRNITAPAPAFPADLLPGDYVVIAVSDTGTGMTAEVAARATEPFFTTKEIGRGTGLGLSMALGFAVQSGGGLRIDSQLGQGTTVEIFLPRAAAVASVMTPEMRADPPPSVEPGLYTILLVDDDALVGAAMAALLNQQGYTVVEARSGAAALRYIEGNGVIDLVITDYAMPDLSGLDVIAATHRRRPGLPVLLITGYAERPAVGDAPWPTAVLHKPFAPAALLAQIQALLTRAGTPSTGVPNVVPFKQS